MLYYNVLDWLASGKGFMAIGFTAIGFRAKASGLLVWLAISGGLCGAAFGQVTSPPTVVATIKPVHALVAAVMAGVGQPKLVVDGAGSPHTYALKPSDAQMLHGATLVFRSSEQVEPFTAKILKSMPRSVEVVTLEDSPESSRCRDVLALRSSNMSIAGRRGMVMTMLK